MIEGASSASGRRADFVTSREVLTELAVMISNLVQNNDTQKPHKENPAGEDNARQELGQPSSEKVF